MITDTRNKTPNQQFVVSKSIKHVSIKIMIYFHYKKISDVNGPQWYGF